MNRRIFSLAATVIISTVAFTACSDPASPESKCRAEVNSAFRAFIANPDIDPTDYDARIAEACEHVSPVVGKAIVADAIERYGADMLRSAIRNEFDGTF